MGVKVMSIGFLVDEGAPVIWRGPMVMSAITQLLREVPGAPLDVLVVDMPPGTGDTQLTMAQNVPLAGAVIVSTPQDLALIDARRGIAMFKQVKVPLLGIVENMSYFVCPHCGGRTEIFAHAGARHEAEALGVPFLGEIPLDAAIRAHSDDGKPVVASMPGSPQAEAYIDIARSVAATLEAGAPGAKPRRASGSSEGASMAWPTDITAHAKTGRPRSRLRRRRYDPIDAPKRLRVESPSAEVQGHRPAESGSSPARRTSGSSGIEPIGNYAIRIVFDDGHERAFHLGLSAEAGGLRGPHTNVIMSDNAKSDDDHRHQRCVGLGLPALHPRPPPRRRWTST